MVRRYNSPLDDDDDDAGCNASLKDVSLQVAFSTRVSVLVEKSGKRTIFPNRNLVLHAKWFSFSRSNSVSKLKRC